MKHSVALSLAISAVAAGSESFERARLVLETRCLSCHCPEKTKGELLLTTREDFLKSMAVQPGKSSTSELIDWLGALVRGGLSEEALADRIPFLGTLMKKEQDVEAVSRRGRGWTKH